MANIKKTSTAPDYTGLSVRVVDLEKNPNFPASYEGDIPVGFLDDYNVVSDASREVTKYKPLNDRDFEPMISMGAIEYAAISASILYDPEGSDGVNLMEGAFNKNAEIGLIVEAYNNGTKTGTTYLYKVKLSKFSIKGQKSGKMQAEIEAEVIGAPRIKLKAQAWADAAQAKVKELEAKLTELTKLKTEAEAKKTEAENANQTAQQGSDEGEKTRAAEALAKATADYDKANKAVQDVSKEVEAAKKQAQEAQDALKA